MAHETQKIGNFEFSPTLLPDVVLIRAKRFGDARGWFSETFQRDAFTKANLPADFYQDNHSGSELGVLRGLHYQIGEAAQGKIVRVVAGEVFDIAVDVRHDSPSFGQWVGEYLTADNGCQLWVPRGFAHGFKVLSPWAEFVYKTTHPYRPEQEAGLNPSHVLWPRQDLAPILNLRDQNWPDIEAIRQSQHLSLSHTIQY